MKIHFGTPNFFRITKDEKANFVTKLSAVGGTLGLLTGFSIISGAEMFYFAAKMFVSLASMFNMKRDKKRIASLPTVILVESGENKEENQHLTNVDQQATETKIVIHV